MSIPASALSIKEAITSYLALLKEIDEDNFIKPPPHGGWSSSEIYCHVLQVNARSILALERCIHAKPKHRSSGPNLIARLIFFMGIFPPLKIKSPPNIAFIVKCISKEEAKNDLIKSNDKIKELLPKLIKTPKDNRIRHPRFGRLNSHEWLRFIEIHTRHHLKQLERIRKSS
ncbi:DinB family protein [Arcticibacter eurypsychrophilus]|uniref:DinB family protein n=1 Tax=Arcticibacter eurypsychrophilus TaxID=1434752 RepID=UPI00084D85EF|nr:DinB family protein [Arcticibacter eurypsychrophilus]